MATDCLWVMEVPEGDVIKGRRELGGGDATQVADVNGAFAVGNLSTHCGEVAGGNQHFMGLLVTEFGDLFVALYDARLGARFHGVEALAFDGTANIAVAEEWHCGDAEFLASGFKAKNGVLAIFGQRANDMDI